MDNAPRDACSSHEIVFIIVDCNLRQVSMS